MLIDSVFAGALRGVNGRDVGWMRRLLAFGTLARAQMALLIAY
jgi:hypothetical protein